MGKNPTEKLKAKAAAAKEKGGAEKAEGKKGKTAAAEAHAEKKAHKAHHAKTKPREEMKCKITSCKRAYKAKGYCKPHYREWRHGKFGQARYKCCGDLNCFKPMAMNRHGYCEEHFQNYYVKGMEVTKAAPAEKEEKAAPAADAGAQQAAG